MEGGIYDGSHQKSPAKGDSEETLRVENRAGHGRGTGIHLEARCKLLDNRHWGALRPTPGALRSRWNKPLPNPPLPRNRSELPVMEDTIRDTRRWDPVDGPGEARGHGGAHPLRKGLGFIRAGTRSLTSRQAPQIPPTHGTEISWAVPEKLHERRRKIARLTRTHRVRKGLRIARVGDVLHTSGRASTARIHTHQTLQTTPSSKPYNAPAQSETPVYHHRLQYQEEPSNPSYL